MENILWGYILFMSVLTFSVCGVDKFAAQRQKRRVLFRSRTFPGQSRPERSWRAG